MRCLGYRYQRSLARVGEVHGVGFVTGASVRLRFLPAPPSTGIVFLRADLRGSPAVKACAENVTGTNRRTIIGKPPAQVELVEHVLAALHGMRIDNCFVELNAPEPPGLDGSSRGFVAALRGAGVQLQTVRRQVWGVEQPISLTEGDASLTIHPTPHSGLRMSYLLNYGARSPIPMQRFTHELTPEAFPQQVHDCRTFLLREEAEALQKQGLGQRTQFSDLLVFGADGPIDNKLRYADEPARHKVLDMVGDLALFGHDLRGHVIGCRSGHSLNVALVRRLIEEMPQAHVETKRLAA